MCSVAEIEQLEAAMLQMGVPDTQVVKKAEAQIKVALQQWQCVIALTTIIKESTHVYARQLGAVLLRVKINRFWKSIALNDQTAVKTYLLESLVKEQERIVALNITYVIAALSKVLFRESGENGVNGWPELLEFLQTFARDRNPGRQELSMLLFFALTETIGTFFHEHFDSLLALYKSVLENPADERARVAGLKACSALIEFVGDGEQVVSFRELIPHMLLGLKSSADDENVAIPIMEVVSLLAESPAPVLNPHVLDCAKVLLMIISSRDLSLNTRRAAAVTLRETISFKTRYCVRAKLYNPILEAAVQVIQEDYEPFKQKVMEQENADENADEDGEDEEAILRNISKEMLQAVSENFPRKQIFKPILEAATSRMQAIGPENAPTRWVGLMVLLHSTEGLSADSGDGRNNLGDKQYLAPLLKIIIGIAQTEPEPNLRASALMCISEWVECCPEIWDHSHKILPTVLVLLDDTSAGVRASACDVLDLVCENIDETHLLANLGPIVEKLLRIIEDNRGRWSLKSTALDALSTVLVTARDHYKPFFEHTAPILARLMSLTDGNMLQIRAYATRAMGHLAIAASGTQSLSREEKNRNISQWESLLFEALTYAMNGLQFDDLTLNQMTFEMFGDFAIALGERIDSQVEALVHVLVDACTGEDGIEYSVEDREGTLVPQNIIDEFGRNSNKDQDEVDLNSENDDDGVGYSPGVKMTMNVRTAMVDSKVKALYGLEQLVINASFSAISPFLEDILRSAKHLADYVHPEVRMQAISVLKELVLAVTRAHPLPPLPQNLKEIVRVQHTACHRQVDEEKCWLPGIPAQYQLPTSIQNVMNNVFLPVVFEAIQHDDDKVVVASCFTCIETLTAHLGPAMLQSKIDELMTLTHDALKRKLLCQRHDYVNEDEEDEEFGEVDNDVILFDEVCSMLGMVAQACGNAFNVYMPKISAELFKTLNAGSTSELQKVTVLGTFSEILVAFGPNNCNGYMSNLLEIAVQNLSSNAAPTTMFNQPSARTISRNAAFLIGTIIELGNKELASPSNTSLLMNVLNEIGNLFQLSEPCNQAISDFVRSSGENAKLPLEITDIQAVIDNASGAVARVLIVGYENLPVDQILPSLLSALPLKSDFDEAFAIFHCLYILLEKKHPALMGSIPELLNIFAVTLQGGKVEGEGYRYILESLRYLNTNYPQEMNSLRSSIPADTFAILDAAFRNSL